MSEEFLSEADLFGESPAFPGLIMEPAASSRRPMWSLIPSPGRRVALALTFGAVALGALAIGALAIGSLAIGRLAIGKARFKTLEIDTLILRRLDGPRSGS